MRLWSLASGFFSFRFTVSFLVAGACLVSGAAHADDPPLTKTKTRWQMLPLSSLFYSDVGGQKIVTAGIDVPCGATPLGALLVERKDRLFVAGVAVRPLAACAKLPQRQYFRMPFIDSKAYKVIEPMRGDLDGMKVTELPVRALKTSGVHRTVDAEVTCGIVAGGILVMPAASKSYRVAALGFKLPARQAAAKCRAPAFQAESNRSVDAARVQKISVRGLQPGLSYRVLQRKVPDLRKLGVLKLRGIDQMTIRNDQATIKFRRKCFEVPVGLAVVPKGSRQALAVVVARYVNAPCVIRRANVAKLPSLRGVLNLRGNGLAGEWDLAQLRQSTVLSQADVDRFDLGQIKMLRAVGASDKESNLVAAKRADLNGVVIALSKHRSRGFVKTGWFVFTAKSGNYAGRMAMRSAAFGRYAPLADKRLTDLSENHLRRFARQMAGSAGAPTNAISRRPMVLNITSAL